MAEKEKLIVFDTTLRDGEQSPGASMTREEKMRIAKALERMRVDVIEAGFPAASNGDFEAVQAVARLIKDSRVCGLARARGEDIDRAGEALRDANAGRIHTFIATSPIHMKMKLQMEPDAGAGAGGMGRKACAPATATMWNSRRRMPAAPKSDFLCRIVEAAIDAGATTINIPDTVGYNVPEQFGALIATLRERIPNSDKAVFSVHCHNDLGLAVANSLAAVISGARQVECTINGLGERAGNAALEESRHGRAHAPGCLPLRYRHRRHARSFRPRRLVANITGFAVQPNKAIVGANAFAHESGIHQDGVLKSRETYEIMRAEDVGWATNRMVLGKHSGRNAFRTRLKDLGVVFDSEEHLNEAFARFKDLADKKHEIFDEDLQALVTEANLELENESIRLVALRVCSETGETPEARVVLRVDGEEQHGRGGRAAGRWTPPSAPSISWWPPAPSCCCIR